MESFMGDLSACETMIMKVIWDAKEDIALQDLIRELTVKEKRHIFIRKKVWQPIGMSCYNSSWSFGLTENHPHFCLPGVKKINCPARKQTGSEK